DAAARVCGAAALSSALRRTAALEANEWAEIRAARLDARGAEALRRAPLGSATRSTTGLYKL
ncbi:hypothetical protein, partial [uncultured Amnibacterium sp.]|uniref:hypothetical protein n=1 Tax=uncultured Amnibacterium sp. TaxID=1631851 RepID=UPI0035CC2120